MKVYISGPITGLEEDVFRKAFNDRAALLAAGGLTPVNPLMVEKGDCACPPAPRHLWSCCLKADLRALLDCDAISTLPGWERSHGARIEVMVAGVAGLTFLSDSDILEKGS